ncbi:Beta-1,3-galactosyltransferase 5 [Halotydeus destructor]|nr:Beta-1,3-galactosyltransferase 5 [Halotydeus destructor]
MSFQKHLIASLIVMCLLYTLCFICTMEEVGHVAKYEQITGSSYHHPAIDEQKRHETMRKGLRPLSKTDFKQLIDLDDFKFLINNNRCKVKKSYNYVESINSNVADEDEVDDDVFLLVFVHSAPQNEHKRKVLRQTWANESLFSDTPTRMRVIFTLGSVVNESLQAAIVAENTQYQDIVQGNFRDTYRNLTYKHVMGLKWVTYFCPQVKFVLKTDDDIFVDILQLIFYLKGQHSMSAVNSLMACNVITNPYPTRSNRTKWMVTYEEYPRKYYPPYCAGWGILMTPDVVFRLYDKSKSLPYFWVDDVHVSGLLAEQIQVKHTDFRQKIATGSAGIKEWVEQKYLTLPPLFSHPDSSLEQIQSLWNKTLWFYQTKYTANLVASL